METHSFAEIEKEFIERVHNIVWCSAATLDTRNRLRSRILHPAWEAGSENATGWIGTRRQSLKARHLKHNPHISLAYIADVVRPVYVDCRAEWEDDPGVRRRVWDLFKSFPPPLGYDFGNIFAGPDQPDFGLLKLTPWRIEMDDVANRENRKIWLAAATAEK